VHSNDVDGGLSVARILALANQKGGVGKTTTAINLAAALAIAGRRVLLVDIDPQANATSGLGLPKDGKLGMMHVLLRPERIHEAVVQGVLPGLDMLPGSPMLVNIERTIGEVPDREQRLRQAVSGVKDRYDAIVIDCPPSLGIITRNALRASDGIIVPIQTEYYAMEGLSQILSAIKAARDPKSGRPDVEGVLFTMYDRRLGFAREVVADIRAHLQGQTYETKIPRDVALGEAPSFGKCIFDYDLRSRGAWAYLEFAKEVLDGGR